MNVSALTRNYDRLTPEERFRLILAAGARGDEAEQDRLANAGQRLTLSMRDHAPYADAFDELALLVFIELLDAAAYYLESWDLAAAARFDEEDEGDEGEEGEEGDEAEEEAAAEPAEEDGGERTHGQRMLDLALAAGYLLRTKAGGWKLFCERLNIPPFALWEGLPGFDRLQRALALAEKAAFVPEGFLRWLNAIRPDGEPELTEIPLTVEGLADATMQLFRLRAQWWGGR